MNVNHSFEKLMEFRAPKVVQRVSYEYGLPEDEVNELFIDLLKFLWFSTQVKDKKHASIDAPILMIDVVWHSFLMFTEEYSKFCMEYFGYFLHHKPNTEPSSVAESLEEARESKRLKYQNVYRILGRDTFVRWYIDFPEKYPLERICSLRENKLSQLKL